MCASRRTDSLQSQCLKIQPEVTSPPKMRSFDAWNPARRTNQTKVQTTDSRYLGRGDERQMAAPAFRLSLGTRAIEEGAIWRIRGADRAMLAPEPEAIAAVTGVVEVVNARGGRDGS